MLSMLLVFTAITMQLQSPLLMNEEWVAEGWQITNRVEYRLSNYVEPHSISRYGTPQYFIELSVTEEGKFRIGLAGGNEVVFINDDGSTKSMVIPDYSDIYLFPNHYFGAANNCIHAMNRQWESFFVDIQSQEIIPVDVSSLRFGGTRFDWFMDQYGRIGGVEISNLVFFNTDGAMVNHEEYQYDIMVSRIPNWAIGNGNTLIAMNMDDLALIAYDLLGSRLWEIPFPEVTAGTAPLAVSNDGTCTAASKVTNGIIILDEAGAIVNHLLENYYTLSLTVSPEGQYVAGVFTPRLERGVRGMPEMHVFNLRSGSSMEIELISDEWLPSVRRITDDGALFCGYNLINGYNDWDISGRHLVLFDEFGNIIWTSNMFYNAEFNSKNIARCTSYPYGINTSFADYLVSTEDGYRLAYMDPVLAEIVILELSKI